MKSRRGTNIAGGKPCLRRHHETLQGALRRALDAARGNHPQLCGPLSAGHCCAGPLEEPGARQVADGELFAAFGLAYSIALVPGAC